MSPKDVPFPGIASTSDGTGSAVWVETHICQGACAYPITPSSNMGEGFQRAIAGGQKNLWGEGIFFLEPESEHSSASACEGYALAGGRVVNFTSGQGLVLMKEVLFTIAGKRLPAVFHIGARALTTQSLNIHAGHDDVMAVSDCGWGMLFARNAQEVCDLALVARRAAENTSTPFLVVQDGFLTTHTVEDLLLPEPEFMKEYTGNPNEKLVNLMDPHHAVMSGVVQNQDSYMKGKVAQRFFYDKLLGNVEEAMEEFGRKTGRSYRPVRAYKMEDAEYAILGLGGAMETAEATADHLRQERGMRVGVVHVTSFRPFPGPEVVRVLSKVRAVSIVERLDNPMAQSNPLTLEVKAALADAISGAEGYPKIDAIPRVFSGSAGLGSRDIRPGHFVAVAENMVNGNGKRYFSLGIDHPTALKEGPDPDVRPPGAFSMRGHSVGGYGSVTTNKVIASIAGEVFGLHVQAYPKYGSEKKGLPTTYFLTIAEDRVRTHCEINQVDFVPLNDVNSFHQGNPLGGLAEGGTVFLQSPHRAPAEIWAGIPERFRKMIRDKTIRVLALDTVEIAREVATDASLVQRMQGIVLLGVFLRNTPFAERKGLSEDAVFAGVERALRKYFGKRGEAVIQDNLKAVRRGYQEAIEIPRNVIEA